jgi:valyl-tRNA synthetase
MTDDAHMNEAAGEYAGLERFVARARIIADLEKLGLLEKVAEHTHSVGTCDRCKAVVEPRISTQWFMKMKPLATPAAKVVLDGLIEVVPDNQRTILLQWFENIRDWCISRQLWWGHRIPIWHCADCKEMVPALDSRVEIVEGHAHAASPPTKCAKCGSSKLTQDKDVLDTWFSSALWPFSTLGWPDDTDDLRTYYPTSLLISGYDILFFWDARMIMMGLQLSADRFENVGERPASGDSAARQGTASAVPKSSAESGALAPEGALASRIPFRRLYLHSLVRTAEGAKMSKTKGTGVDPLGLTEKFGTDALRYMLASMAAPGTDIILSEDRILGARAFANKIWNAARFLFLNLEKAEAAAGITLEEVAAPEIRSKAPYVAGGGGALANRWMFSRLSAVSEEVSRALEDFRFHEACQTIYHFFWGDFCDWYIEWVKPQLAAADRAVAVAAWRNIFAALDAALRLLHPVMPFLTEELWHRLPQPEGAQSIALDKFPEPRADGRDPLAEKEMLVIQNIIIAARNIRAEMKIDPKQKIPAVITPDDTETGYPIDSEDDAIKRLANLSEIRWARRREFDASHGLIRSVSNFDVYIAYGEGMDKVAEIARLRKEIDRLAKDVASKQSRLADRTFISKAPAKIVEDLRATLASRQIEHQKLLDRLAQLE